MAMPGNRIPRNKWQAPDIIRCWTRALLLIFSIGETRTRELDRFTMCSENLSMISSADVIILFAKALTGPVFATTSEPFGFLSVIEWSRLV
eukprot:TRINITY_DN1371_c0_g2_i1.p1 TRINITY_DN1371_c0_g2~~TRINITY_DN1371_c0_g2_i1.p1  ORF type:complete len:105 (+),score=2.23 TRINITY_DN1371_c0_g2_i1:44-316(+)